MSKVVILGSGLTGISAAYHLEKKGFLNFKIFEKESVAGGLCRTIIQDGYTFDYTGHLLHINDPYFEKLIKEVVNLESFEKVYRRSFIWSKNCYTHYPFQINLKGLPEEFIAECIEGFVKRKKLKNPKSFYQWVQTHFGNGLGKHFFFPFQNKIFDYDIKKITPLWTGRFVPKTSLKEMIAGSLNYPKDQNVGYNNQFYYPKKGGIQYWVDKLKDRVQTKIETNFEAKKIDLKKKTVLFQNGHEEAFDILINTIPLDTFLKISKEPTNSTLKKAQTKLIANSVVNFNLGIKDRNISDKHWIYFPENEYPFYRIGFPHNFTKSAVPDGCSSLYGEFSFVKKSKKVVEQKLAESLKQAKKLLNISQNEIATEKIINISHAYVIYNQWRDANLPKLHESLNRLGVHSVGRYGEWKYSSMQEAVLDGKAVVDKLFVKPAKKERILFQKKLVTQKEI